MTKQEFLSGKVFKVSNSIVGNTYQFIPSNNNGDSDSNGYIQKNIMSGDRVVLSDHEGNVTKIGTKTFEMFTFVMDKKVKLKYRFDELI
jgi:hypothetical protein